MYFYVTVETEDGDYYVVANAGNEYYAEKLAKKYYQEDGEIVLSAQAEMFNTFEHGDYKDYEILT
jgi:hypothetical protein